MTKLSKQIATFIGLVLLQVIVLNNVNIGGYINPYVFPLFILLMPFETKKWQLLLVAFGLGLTIDLFNGTMGMHVFATVFVAYIRSFFLKTIQAKSEKSSYPSLGSNGFAWMLLYISILLGVHHTIYFFIEAGNFESFFQTLLLLFLSLLFSVLISFLLLFTFNNKKK